MKNKIKNTMFVAGGGTGGHLFPALAIGKCLESQGMNIIYIGSKFGIEKDYYINNNIKSKLLNIKGIQRSFTFNGLVDNLYFPIRFMKSYFESIKLIKKYKPIAIIGTGGYSSGMPLLAGLKMEIPTFIQEQNSVPGIVTKSLYKKVNYTFVAYDYTKKLLNNSNILLSGNPIRENLKSINKEKAKVNLGLDINKKTIFILGGSQGSSSFNEHIYRNIDFYANNRFQIYLQCGKKNYSNISKKMKNHTNIIVKEFIDNISMVYSASDIVISRSGALAISELCYFKKAMILIPFKYAAKNHQMLNAQSIEKEQACILINEDDLKIGKLEESLDLLFDSPGKIKQLEENSNKISYKNSTSVITEKIKEIAYG